MYALKALLAAFSVAAPAIIPRVSISAAANAAATPGVARSLMRSSVCTARSRSASWTTSKAVFARFSASDCCLSSLPLYQPTTPAIESCSPLFSPLYQLISFLYHSSSSLCFSLYHSSSSLCESVSLFLVNNCFLLRFLTWGTSEVPGGIEQPLCRAHVPYTYRAGLRGRNKHETCKCQKIEFKAPGIQY